jgi:predicted aspartyl protease
MKSYTFPFVAPFPGEGARPYVPVKITNPDTGKSIEMYALVDTGADECALPASFARILEHNLHEGTKKQIRTGNGVSTAYGHTAVIDMLDFSAENTVLDYMPNLSVALLGTRSFLSKFVITFDYPAKTVTFELQD